MAAPTTTTTTPSPIPRDPPFSLTLHPNPSPGRIFLRSQFLARRPPLPPSVSLAGQSALITGASTGLGLRASRQLLALGLSRLILAVRDPTRAEGVAGELRGEFPGARVEVWEVEMGRYESVVGLVGRVEGEFNKRGERLHVVVLNAGMAAAEFERSEETGHERVVQVNYLGTVLLAVLLLPLLRDRTGARPGRLTIVSSGGVFNAKLPNRGARPFLESFDDEEALPWDPTERYFASKVLGMLFFVRLLEYLPPADELIVNLVDPGFCKGTELHRESTGAAKTVFSLAKTLTGRSLEDGASTYVDAAVIKGKESHGCFVMDWKIFPFYYAVYEPEGAELMDTLFEETMAELEFAGVRNILEGIKAEAGGK
ncbi:hypothetical protein C8A05DRAFT_42095 [Staphylotrichum tortipilum]|uniref:Uncharacterized protein n=1 Tax=Staphylotrichum tortipilum TaxID=2831512 RepID=A0AAN6MPU8_9PEZI|nr:hypothetical protein C8A05DRAFT_42095 [Staphylotrichum longicolle]